MKKNRAPKEEDLYDRVKLLLTAANFADFHVYEAEGECGVRARADVRGAAEQSLLLPAYAAVLRACGLTVQEYGDYLYVLEGIS